MGTDSNINATMLLNTAIGTRIGAPTTAATPATTTAATPAATTATTPAATTAATTAPTPAPTTAATPAATTAPTTAATPAPTTAAKRRRLMRIIKKLKTGNTKNRILTLSNIARGFKGSKKGLKLFRILRRQNYKQHDDILENIENVYRNKNKRYLEDATAQSGNQTPAIPATNGSTPAIPATNGSTPAKPAVSQNNSINNAASNLQKDAEGPSDLYTGSYELKKADDDLKQIVEVWKRAEEGFNSAIEMKASLKLEIKAISTAAAVYLGGIATMLEQQTSNGNKATPAATTGTTPAATTGTTPAATAGTTPAATTGTTPAATTGTTPAATTAPTTGTTRRRLMRGVTTAAKTSATN